MSDTEAHTILNTLNSVKDHVDCWHILDTGSTDGTQAKIREALKKLPGQLYEEPFVDYGATRNRILDLANSSSARPHFTLMLSADETMLNGAHMRSFLSSMRVPQSTAVESTSVSLSLESYLFCVLCTNQHAMGSMHGAYPVVMNAGMNFDSVRIARADGGWRYVGRVHEYLTGPNKGETKKIVHLRP